MDVPSQFVAVSREVEETTSSAREGGFLTLPQKCLCDYVIM
jgi:hypothetical protein